MATIRDVAARAGVSLSTVSHVINKTRFVSEETRERVLNAMQELQYSPNRLASSLRSKNMRTKTIGLLIPDSTNSFFAEVLRGVEDACFERRYSVIVGNSDNKPEKELNYLEVLLSKQVDGIALVSAGGGPESLELIERRNACAVVVDREIPSTSADTVDLVTVDNEGGGYLATRHLISLGHKEIACIAGPSLLQPSAGRFHGYERALAEAGMMADPAMTVRGDFRAQSGYQSMKEILPKRPTAVFVCNDLMAFGALNAIHQSGLHVPHDISIVGFDDIDLASFSVPPLTTISQPAYEMGVVAVELMMRRLGEPKASARHEHLPVSLVERESCRKMA